MEADVAHRKLPLKSRKGCLQCKKRKIKCDERGPPSCSPCVKHRIQCSFGESRLPATPATPATPASSTSGSAAIPESARQSPCLDPPSTFPASNLLDLELLHNFTISTHITIASRQNIQKVYQTFVIQQAFKHDFLLHSILAISAFHINSQQDNASSMTHNAEVYLVAARVHYDAAVSSLRRHVTNVTSQNCHALFASSCLIFLSSFARQQATVFQDNVVGDPHGHIIEWLCLLLGIPAVLGPSWSEMKAGPLAGLLIEEGDEDFGIVSVSGEAAEKLDKFCAFLESSRDENVTDKCIGAIDVLRKVFGTVLDTGNERVTFFWPSMIPNDYLTLLKEKNPEALIVLTYYCVLLYRQNHLWWLRGWPAYVINAVQNIVDDTMKPWLQWPWRVIHSDTQEHTSDAADVVKHDNS